MNDKVKMARRGVALWITDPEFEEIDTGVAPPKRPILGPKPPQAGGFPTNPTLKGPKKKKPKDWAR